jgi:hypothetical protein
LFNPNKPFYVKVIRDRNNFSMSVFDDAKKQVGGTITCTLPSNLGLPETGYLGICVEDSEIEIEQLKFFDLVSPARGVLKVKGDYDLIYNNVILKGEQGEKGIGIINAEINEEGELKLILSNKSEIEVGKIVGTSLSHKWEGTNLIVTSASGTTSTDLGG